MSKEEIQEQINVVEENMRYAKEGEQAHLKAILYHLRQLEDMYNERDTD